MFERLRAESVTRGDPITSKLEELSQKSQTDKRNAYKLFSAQSPLARTKAEIRKHLEAAVEYRISVLTNVSTFEGLSIDVLSFLAQNMEEVYFVQGDNIITQDDLGDSFFVLEVGIVSVTRKTNLYEPRKELKRLRANSHFGELALINEEPRSATITVISAHAKCLKMTKMKFDEILSLTKMFQVGSRSSLSEGITEKVALFKSLSAATRTKLLESMSKMSFSPGTYICRQGTIGNIFYIITEGSCKVTLNTDDWKEKEVNRIHTGDHFGEIALIDVSGKRSANVVAFDNVKCLTLSKADFGFLLKGVRTVMVQSRKMRSVTDQQALGRTKTSNTDLKKDSNLTTKTESTRNRRISIMDIKGVRVEKKVPTLLKRLGKFMSESLYFSLYGRMYREMLINPLKPLEYGEKAAKIMRDCDDYTSAVDAIRLQVKVILEKEIAFRSSIENLFICGLMRQKNGVRDRLTKGWLAHQYNDFCRTIGVLRVKPMKRIIDLGSKGTTAYLILRGTVRIFSGVGKQVDSMDGKKKSYQFEEDLVAGEYFGEAVLSGVRTRLITALATTQCDLITFEDDNFLAAQDVAINMSMEDRMLFLSQVSFFKNWEPYRLYRVAHALTQIDVNKDCNILRNDDISKNIYFVLKGQVDIFPSPRSKTALLSIQKFEYFGESGFMNATASASSKSSHFFVEEYTMKALSRVDLLLLPESEFHLLDRAAVDIIINSYYVRKEWREERHLAVVQEMRVFRDFKKKSEKTPHSILTISNNTNNCNIYNNNNSINRSYDCNDEKEKYSRSSTPHTLYPSGIASFSDSYMIPHSAPPSFLVSSSLADFNFQLGSGPTQSVPSSSFSSFHSSSQNNNNHNQLAPQYFGQNSTPNTPSNLQNSLILQSLNSQLSTAIRNISNNNVPRKYSDTTNNTNFSNNGSGTDSGVNTARGNNGNNGISERVPLGTTYQSIENHPRLLDLEDIPSLLDNGFDPLMVLGTANTNKDKTRIYNNLAYLRTPQLSRMSTYTSRKSQVENIKKYRELAKCQTKFLEDVFPPKPNVSISDGRDLVKSHSHGLSVILSDCHIDDRNEKTCDDCSVDEEEEFSRSYTDEYISKTGFESSMLFGSGKIPSVKSYCEILTPLEKLNISNSKK